MTHICGAPWLGACDLYNICEHVGGCGQMLVLYITCDVVYNIVYYTSGHMLRTGILSTWKLGANPGQVT